MFLLNQEIERGRENSVDKNVHRGARQMNQDPCDDG
jgi:hypothetical protein